MILLVCGVLVWTLIHFFKRIAPDARAAMTAGMGDASKAIIALIVVLSVVMMVIGYRSAEFVTVWSPPSFFGHINNLLMLVAFYIYGAGGPKGARVWIGTKLRHPQLVGFSVWALAHLLANGDLASIVLFGGLLVWAIMSVQLINRSAGPWTPPAQASVRKEIVLVVITLVVYAVVAGIHTWLGVSPFGGV